MRFLSPGRGFVLLYALAYAGVFVSFMPVIMVLLPLKAAAVGGEDRVALLSAIALGGALVASVANIAFGMLSDRTRRTGGTRRPWIGLGLALLIVAFGMLHLSRDAVSLLVTVALWQVALNILFSALLAVMADEIPDAQKGTVAGLMGVAQPLGSLAAVLVTLPGLGEEVARYAVLSLLFTAMLLPFLLFAREGSAPAAAPSAQEEKRRWSDFGLSLAARMLLQVAGNGLSTYGYYYFLAVPGAHGERAIVIAMAGATLVAVALTVASGWASDRMMRRKPFLAGAAVAMASGLAVMAGTPSWTLAVLGYGAALAGLSVFLATQSALSMQLLPSPDHAGRDLGVLNLANTIPAMIAPVLVLALAKDDAHSAALWLTMAAVTLAGGAAGLAIRAKR